MEDHESIYITINHLDDFAPIMNLKVGDTLVLKKEPDNIYDDEAIAAYTENNYRCGYVANSVSSVARGSHSAGRVYDRIEGHVECVLRFVIVESGIAIAEVRF